MFMPLTGNTAEEIADPFSFLPSFPGLNFQKIYSGDQEFITNELSGNGFNCLNNGFHNHHVLREQHQEEPLQQKQHKQQPQQQQQQQQQQKQQRQQKQQQQGTSQKSTAAEERLCLVCGDKASGVHYGVASCEACKAFFKRTVQGNIKYRCPASGSCIMTKKRRKACQACRFQKCLKEGMLTEGIRLDRLRGARNQAKTARIVAQQNSIAQPTGEETKVLGSSENRMVQCLLKIEPQKVYAMPKMLNSSLIDSEFRMMSLLSDLSDRELVATIGWAKQIPGFVSLLLKDQMNLLQGSWLDILCFNIAFRSSPYKGVLMFADDFVMSDGDSSNFCIPLELNVMLRKLARKLTEMVLTQEEYVLMKAMLLMNPDLNVENPKSVQHLRDQMFDAMLDYERPRGAICHRRICNLLMVIPLITHCRLLARDYWNNVKRSGRITLNKLLSEMIDCVTESSL